MTVQRDPDNPFGKPPDISEYERIKTFLYNGDEGTVCGKDAKNWGKNLYFLKTPRQQVHLSIEEPLYSTIFLPKNIYFVHLNKCLFILFQFNPDTRQNLYQIFVYIFRGRLP